MFHMVNEHGNVHRFVKTEAKKNAYIAQGYREVQQKADKPKTARKKVEKEELPHDGE